MKKGILKKKVRLESMSKSMKGMEKRIHTHIEKAIGDLAGATAKGFTEVDRQFITTNEKIDRNHISLSGRLDYVLLHYARREEFKSFDARIKKLERK